MLAHTFSVFINKDFLLFLPELLIGVSALMTMVFGLIQSDKQYGQEALIGVCVCVCVLIAFWLQFWQIPQSTFYMHQTMVYDRFGLVMKGSVVCATLSCLLFTINAFEKDVRLRFEFTVLMLLSSLGMMVMISSQSLLSTYLGLELQSLCLYVLICFLRKSSVSGEAAVKYFILSVLATGILLYGVSVIYGITGSVQYSEVGQALYGMKDLRVSFAMLCLIIGLAFKLSAAPCHMWTPDVYEGASMPVTALLATGTKIAAMAVLIRIVGSLFLLQAVGLSQLLSFLACVSMVIGALGALMQSSIKRFLAYSTIANIGYTLIGISILDLKGFTYALLYLILYMIVTLGLFSVLTYIRIEDRQLKNLSDLSGLSTKDPGTALGVALLLLSLGGIPPLAGFISKLLLFSAAIENGLLWLVLVAVFSSVLGAFYYLRVIKIMYFDAPLQFVIMRSPSLRIMLGLACVISIVVVFIPQHVVGWLNFTELGYSMQ